MCEYRKCFILPMHRLCCCKERLCCVFCTRTCLCNISHKFLCLPHRCRFPLVSGCFTHWRWRYKFMKCEWVFLGGGGITQTFEDNCVVEWKFQIARLPLKHHTGKTLTIHNRWCVHACQQKLPPNVQTQSNYRCHSMIKRRTLYLDAVIIDPLCMCSSIVTN